MSEHRHLFWISEASSSSVPSLHRAALGDKGTHMTHDNFALSHASKCSGHHRLKSGEICRVFPP
jgi:hypothetical protein